MNGVVRHGRDFDWSFLAAPAAFAVELVSVFGLAVDYTVRVAALVTVAAYVGGC